MAKYEPEVLERLAGRFESTAKGIEIAHAVIGGFFTAVAAAMFCDLYNLATDARGALAIVAFLIGAFFGARHGRYKGLELRVRAQTLLWRVQVEKNTRSRANSN